MLERNWKSWSAVLNVAVTMETHICACVVYINHVYLGEFLTNIHKPSLFVWTWNINLSAMKYCWIFPMTDRIWQLIFFYGMMNIKEWRFASAWMLIRLRYIWLMVFLLQNNFHTFTTCTIRTCIRPLTVQVVMLLQGSINSAVFIHNVSCRIR